MAEAPYLGQIHAVLPRLFALYDVDPVSRSLGLGDRSYWGWKTKDFPNATFQGAVNGLARLVRHGMLPSGIAEKSVLRRIEEMVSALPLTMAADGSLAEAYPNEASFCVTALVLYDVLVARELLGDLLPEPSRARWLELLAPLVGFLERSDETHGFISNHLATAAAALLRWKAVTGDSSTRGEAILERILKAQSDEGWFPEYGGADPGYQSLCLHYLADLRLVRPDIPLTQSLLRCIDWLSHAAHPDGSFGGGYGWRGTRFLAASGIEALASESDRAAGMALFARASIASSRTPPLPVFDEPNLPVMFNVWCWAAALAAQVPLPSGAASVPSQAPGIWRRSFPAAGWVIDKGDDHYTIVGWRKGGVVQHFVSGRCAVENAGVVCANAKGDLASTVSLQDAAVVRDRDDGVEVMAPLVTSTSRLPGAFDFAVLRSLVVTVLRSRRLNELFKRVLVRKIVTGARPSGLRNIRSVTFGKALRIDDRLVGSVSDWRRIEPNRPFHPVHMASCGYWQAQDDEGAA